MGIPGETLRIEVVYALPGSQRVISLSCAPGTTISEAIGRSGILS
ncbi:MAG: RnfH family protein [Gammaproteobacteria bacterium]|nr:RnfH family protein [Gammaproteobacteria bacterium]